MSASQSLVRSAPECWRERAHIASSTFRWAVRFGFRRRDLVRVARISPGHGQISGSNAIDHL